MPQGIYRITTTLNLPSGCILRGDGDPLTKLRFDFANSGTNGIVMQGSPSGSFVSLSNNANKGDTNIELTDATGFAAGDWAELLQNNGTWDTNPSTWADNSVGQIVKITATKAIPLTYITPCVLATIPPLTPASGKLTQQPKQVSNVCILNGWPTQRQAQRTIFL